MKKLLLLATAGFLALIVLLMIANARDPYGGVLADPEDLA